jgi:CBS domain-containing membrane protein
MGSVFSRHARPWDSDRSPGRRVAGRHLDGDPAAGYQRRPVSLASLPHRPARQVVGVLGVALFLVALSLLDVLTRGAVGLPALVPPFGASVVIVFFAPDSDASRAWNVVVGHLACAVAACAVLAVAPAQPVALLAALAVSLGGLLMLATRSFHPPGGATALLAVIAERRLGLGMVLCPVLVGALTLVGTRAAIDLAVARVVPPRG